VLVVSCWSTGKISDPWLEDFTEMEARTDEIRLYYIFGEEWSSILIPDITEPYAFFQHTKPKRTDGYIGDGYNGTGGPISRGSPYICYGKLLLTLSFPP